MKKLLKETITSRSSFHECVIGEFFWLLLELLIFINRNCDVRGKA